MSRAVAGLPYTVVSGDTLTSIAKQAYGDGRRWREIWKANESVLRSGDPNLIFPGEVITIPPDSIIESALNLLGGDALPTLPNKDKDDFTVIVDGEEIPVQGGRVIRTMDTASDGWSASISWNPDNEDLNELLVPFGYKQASCYLGGTLLIDGFLYTVEPSLKGKERRNNLEGWSFTAEIVDSTVKPPYEQNKINLEDRAKEMVTAFGIKVVYDADDTEVFDRVTAQPTETIFSHLSKLASQRGILISSTPLGELLFEKVTTDKPVGTLEEGKPPCLDFSARFDGRKRFNTYKALGQSPGRKNKKKKEFKYAIAKDDVVPKSRFLAFRSNETTAGNIQAAADWRRSKQLADVLTISFPVSSWYDPGGLDLWRENTLVTVVSPAIYVPDGFDFLIRSVEYIFEERGTTAILNLIPPEVYTGKLLVEPWADNTNALLNQIGL
jgi:prophage tail gpP-like protein